MELVYWQRQTPEQPLFPDIEWSKPEQRSRAGKLGIIGGNKLGFAGVAEAYSTALASGVGEVRVLLPDVLKNTLPRTMNGVAYAPSNPSGGLAQEAINELRALGAWSDGLLLIGDAGRNSQTAIVYSQLLRDYQGPAIITRDAADLVRNDSAILAARQSTVLILSFAQLQKLFRTLYYPKILTFSMQLLQLVEALHKFTVTYPITITTLHQDTLVTASSGKVATMPWNDPMRIWRGTVAARASVYYIWNPSRPLESITTSLLSK